MKGRNKIMRISFKSIHWFAVTITILFLIFLILLWPMDSFSYGYFCDDELEAGQIEANMTGYTDLAEKEYTFTFSPKNKHFIGFEIYVLNQHFSESGVLLLDIYDESGKVVDSIEISLKDIKTKIWYKSHIDKKLKSGQIYTVNISAKECSVYPRLPLVKEELLPDENESGNILIGYAYTNSVFTSIEKVLICLFVLAIWGLSIYLTARDSSKWIRVKNICLFLLLTTMMSWNYMYNSMGDNNKNFTNFQMDSDTLVAGVIIAEQNQIENLEGCNLGRYSDVRGDFYSYTETGYITDENWDHGYSLSRAGIVISSGIYSSKVASVGNYVVFRNNVQMKIAEVTVNDSYTNIYFDTDQVLDYDTYGSLDYIRFLDTDGNEMAQGMLGSRDSQYGLQGKIFKSIARCLNYNHSIGFLHLLCSFATAFVLMLLVCIIRKKYNRLLAGCFFVTFLLSPWIVNFARNLYWVEFTWFLPMVAGSFCAWQIHNRRARILSYVGTFIFIMIKSLCGYEYITAVMLGSIAFMLVDFIVAVTKRDKKQSRLLFKAVFITGFAALVGFFAAICIHANLRGGGNIFEGIKSIFERDVLRRTYGADLNDFALSYGLERYALTASVWEVLKGYFHFGSEVITGVPGNLFSLLCMTPFFIFANDYKNRKVSVEQIAMYVVFFLTSVSWFVLAKSHSCVHIRINDVLWYFGFVQICFYIILDKVAILCPKKSGGGTED